MLIFTIHDTKADSHLQPFFAETQAVALRLLDVPCNDASHNFCRFGSDYHLYEIGEFNEAEGFIEAKHKKHVTCLEHLFRDPGLEENETDNPFGSIDNPFGSIPQG